jgi:putative hydrolase of the HAD superfamily
VAAPKAFLIDVYDTILTCDFDVHQTGISGLAGIAARDWNAGYAQVELELNEGRLSVAQGIEQILLAAGTEPAPELVSKLVRKEREMLFAAARLYDDAIPFLKMLRSRGVPTAFVSNCNESTRPLLSALGVSALVDKMVLSCEVGSAKPAPRIYQEALDQLGVAAEDAVFVDDQPGYCAGATALGITAVRIARRARASDPAPAGSAGSTGTAEIAIVGSLLDLEATLD